MINEKLLLKFLDKLSKEFPYKVIGDYDTYCQYNEAWQDCIDRVTRIIEEQPKIDEWIPCSERLPEEKINPVTSDFYEYQVTFKSDDVTDIRHYKFGRGHWWNCGGIMDRYVIAWQPLPEPYQSKGGKESLNE